MIFFVKKSYAQSDFHFMIKKVDQITDSIFLNVKNESEFISQHLTFIVELRKLNDSTSYSRIDFIFNSSELKYHDFNYISLGSKYISLYNIIDSFTETPPLQKLKPSDTIPLKKRLNTDPVSYIHSSRNPLRITFRRNHPFERMPIGSDSYKLPILSPFLIRIEKW